MAHESVYAIMAVCAVLIIGSFIFSGITFADLQNRRHRDDFRGTEAILNEDQDLWATKRDASVVLTAVYVTNPVTESLFQCSGFFISSDGYIGTAGHCCQNSDEGRGTDGAPRVADYIYVSVENVNGYGGFPQSYQARIVGVDGSGDTCELYIDMQLTSNNNSDLPPLTKQNYFKMIDSRNVPTGTPICTIGSGLNQGKAIFCGNLANSRHQDSTMTVIVDNIGLDVNQAPGDSGSPVMTRFGDVIGFTSWSPDDYPGDVFGVSTHLAMPVLLEMMEADRILRSEGLSSKKRRSSKSKYVRDTGDDATLPSHILLNTAQDVPHMRYSKGWLGFLSTGLLSQESYLFDLQNNTCLYTVGQAPMNWSKTYVEELTFTYQIGSNVEGAYSSCTCNNTQWITYKPKQGQLSTVTVYATNLNKTKTNNLGLWVIEDAGQGVLTYFPEGEYYSEWSLGDEAGVPCNPAGVGEAQCFIAVDEAPGILSEGTVLNNYGFEITDVTVTDSWDGQWFSDSTNYYFVFTMYGSNEVKGDVGINITVRLESNYFSATPATKSRSVYGFTIWSVAGGQNCLGGAAAPIFLDFKSPFAGSVNVGDNLITIDDVPIGNGPGLYPMSDVLWTKLPGDNITLGLLTSQSDMGEWNNVTSAVATFPLWLDEIFASAFSYRSGLYYDGTIMDAPVPFSEIPTMYANALNNATSSPMGQGLLLTRLKQLNDKLQTISNRLRQRTGQPLFPDL